MAYYRKRGKKWYFSVSVTNDDGSIGCVERVGGESKPDARVACRDFLRKMDHYGRRFTPEEVILKDYLDEWLENYVEINLKDNTIDSYRNVVKKHLKPKLGNWKLWKLSKIVIQKYINSLKAEEYAKGTVQQILAVLKRSLQDAVDLYDYIEKNPAAPCRIPRYDELPEEAHVFTAAQLKQIFDQFGPDHQFYLPMQLSYHTGMRLGECLALQWKNVDLENRIIKVAANLYDKNGKPKIKLPKSATSIRSIPFDEALYQTLKTAHRVQAEWQLAYGKEYQHNDLVCAKEDGDFMTSNSMRYFNKYCKEVLFGGSFHSFRHTHATYLLECGWSLEDVSKRLGHSSVVITAKTYSHFTTKRITQQKDKLNEAFC